MRVTVETLGCDALVTSGRKWLRGPRGTALLYAGPAVTGLVGPLGADVVNSSLTLDRNRVGTVRFRSDGRRFELWERSIANAIGLGHALGYADRTIRSHPWVLDRITDLAQHAADGLRSIVGVDVWAPPVVESGIVGFVVDGHDPTEVVARCAEEGINISMQVAAAVPFDFARRGRIASCRVAPHYFNEHAEVDRFLAVVRSLG